MADSQNTTEEAAKSFAADDPVVQKVVQLIVEHQGVRDDQVKPDARFLEDIGCDSLDIIELTMSFEENFGLKIPDEVVEKMSTVGDVISYIKEQMPKA